MPGIVSVYEKRLDVKHAGYSLLGIMRYMFTFKFTFKRIAVILGIVLVLLVILLGSFFSDPSASKSRKIATDLTELHRQWQTTDNVQALFQSLTNLPFQSGAAGDDKAWVSHRFSFLGLRWEEYYFIQTPRPVTDTSEWTLYHTWAWETPSRGQMPMNKLLTWRNATK